MTERMSHERPMTIAEMSEEQLRARLAEVNKEILKHTSGLDRLPAPYEESSSGDDNSVESEGVQQALGDVQQRLSNLRREMMEIEQRLSKLNENAA